jgi:adenylate cyclase
MTTKDDVYEELRMWDLAAAAGTPGAADNARLSKKLWAEHGRTRAVLVSDLSGFTRTTRERGLLQFLAVFERAREIGAKAFAEHGGRYLKHEADNLIALFDRTSDAAAAAQAMIREADRHNATIADGAGHVRFCIGISHGHILELGDDAFGDAVNVAFKLGEDIARGGDILLSSDAIAELASLELIGALEPEMKVELSGVTLLARRLPAR